MTATATAADRASVPPATTSAMVAARSPSFRVAASTARKPRNGRTGMSQAREITPEVAVTTSFATPDASAASRITYPPQQLGDVHVERPSPEVEVDDQREADHHLRCGDDDDEEHEDLAVGSAPHAGGGGQGQVDGVEHQLHAHEQHDGVAPDEHPDQAHGEQQRRDGEVVADGHGSDLPY